MQLKRNKEETFNASNLRRAKNRFTDLEYCVRSLSYKDFSGIELYIFVLHVAFWNKMRSSVITCLLFGCFGLVFNKTTNMRYVCFVNFC